MNNVHPKVRAVGVGGAASIIVVWAAAQIGLDVSPEVAAAFSTILTFAGGWIKSS